MLKKMKAHIISARDTLILKWIELRGKSFPGIFFKRPGQRIENAQGIVITDKEQAKEAGEFLVEVSKAIDDEEK